jgi:hypothetical protein
LDEHRAGSPDARLTLASVADCVSADTVIRHDRWSSQAGLSRRSSETAVLPRSEGAALRPLPRAEVAHAASIAAGSGRSASHRRRAGTGTGWSPGVCAWSPYSGAVVLGARTRARLSDSSITSGNAAMVPVGLSSSSGTGQSDPSESAVRLGCHGSAAGRPRRWLPASREGIRAGPLATGSPNMADRAGLSISAASSRAAVSAGSSPSRPR